MSWSIEFMPFVPWPVLWGLAGFGAVLLAVLFWRLRRGAALRLISYVLLLLAIANPQLKQEEREPLNDVVAVVIDESQSQAIAGRTARTEQVRKDLEERLKAIPNLDMRLVRSTSGSSCRAAAATRSSWVAAAGDPSVCQICGRRPCFSNRANAASCTPQKAKK